MTLTIRKLNTRCRSPRTFERLGALIEDVARGPFASELGAHLGPSFDRLPAVIRLKNLRVQLKIPARNLDRVSLAAAWARALATAIHRALAYPSGDGIVFLRRHQTETAYKAAMLHHFATRGLARSWEFPEIKSLSTHSPFEAALELILADATHLFEIFAELARNGWLDLLLAFWDELALERIIQAIASSGRSDVALSIDDVVELGSAVVAPGGLESRWPLSSRRQAIRLWVRTQQRLPLRGIWHGLRLLRKLLETPSILILRNPKLLADPIPFPQWCEGIVTNHPSSRLSARRNVGTNPAALSSILEALRPLVPSAVAPIPTGCVPANMTWIHSDHAGLLLMISIIRRLDLTRFIRRAEFVRFGGIRAFSFLLAGLGMSFLRHWTPSDPIDPAVAIFAGMIPDPDLAGLRQFYSATSPKAIADFTCGVSWSEALDYGASELASAFAARIRGFRKASRDAVVRQFLRIPGRILVEDTQIVVVLDSSPWAVALHLSGMDDPVERVEWLRERRVNFVLEAL